jgi:oligosaccharyl transferase (archaeosortase A-associated)
MVLHKDDLMTAPELKKYRIYIVIALIAFFSAFALWLRLIPMFNLGNLDILNAVGSDDPLYNLRQVEQMLHNFPTYAWFDAMTQFPNGDFIYWGPLFTYILAIMCMITGAATRPEIISAALLVAPLMATVLVPIMYYVGKSCGDWKTGVFASGFIAIVSGQYFYRSFFGYLDHHIAEVFFSTIFCLVYIYTLKVAKETEMDFSKLDTIKRPVFFALLGGIAYLLGVFTMPTMVLFAMIVAIFTLVQFIVDSYRGQKGEYLLLVNGIIFSVAIIGLLLFGIKEEFNQISLALYSFGHIYAYLGLIGGTAVLYSLARYLDARSKHLYPLAIAGIGILFSLILYVVSPVIFNLLISSFFSFFGQAAEVLTVQEARGWDVDLAWLTFNYGIILTIGGLAVLAYKNIKEEHPHQVFTLIWSIIVIVSTWQHIRYEYYLAVNVALLSAVMVTFVLDISWNQSVKFLKGILLSSPDSKKEPVPVSDSKRDRKRKKGGNRPDQKKSYKNVALSFLLIATTLIALMFVVTSVNYSYSNAVSNPIRMNQDWRESLDWLASNTPDTGVDYYAVYDKATFRYPSQAYGVMSWWDYGHMITFIAKRIPNANPFQRGVAGSVGAAAYFMTTSENAANSITDQLGTRFIITDVEMDSGKFWAMATWFNTSASIQPYQTRFAASDPTQPDRYQEVVLNNQSYYLTMISRLHNFDGSMADPQKVYYVEYVDPSVSRISVAVITNAVVMNASESIARAVQYNLKAPAGYHAASYSPAIYLPVEPVPALRHYRLVHESPSNVFGAKIPDIKYVKIFEYVKGAHIQGQGIIEVPLVSNTGRQFTYRQQSTNGEFIVPYSTGGNPYGVKATGKYRIATTHQEFDVPENAVVQGLNIN